MAALGGRFGLQAPPKVGRQQSAARAFFANEKRLDEASLLTRLSLQV
jgi:hypothetical protein